MGLCRLRGEVLPSASYQRYRFWLSGCPRQLYINLLHACATSNEVSLEEAD